MVYFKSLFQEKGTLLEGGIRTAACIWSPMIEKKQRVFKRLFHISDWMPTIYAAAGIYDVS